MQPIEAHKGPFALLISTDGVRKSCATDQDFLELCSQIVPIDNGPQLAEGLAEISAAGSGDDLSIAVGAWDSSSASSRAGLSAPARSVASLLLLLVPLVLTLSAAAWWVWKQQRNWIQAEQPPAGTPAPRDPEPWIAREAEQLCRDPALIGPTLVQRKEQFSQLLSGGLSREGLLDAARQDPLGALVAWSQPRPPQVSVTGQAANQLSPMPMTMPVPLPLPGGCPALEQALASQWRSLSQPRMDPAPRSTTEEG
jgi:hypothetical protein